MTELLKQPQYTPYPIEEQVVAIFAGVRGYLDKVEVNQVTRFEQGLVGEIRSKHAELLKTIREEREISAASEEKLKSIVEAYARTFA